MPSCPRCGVENPAGKAACSSCFAPLSARPDQFRDAAEAAAFTEQAEPRPRSFLKIAVVVLIIIVAAAAVYHFLLSKPGPAGVAGKYLEAVKAGDVALQQEYLSSGAAARRLSGVAILRGLAEKGIAPSAVDPENVAISTDGKKSVAAVLTFAPPSPAQIADLPVDLREGIRGGGRVNVQVILVPEGGDWKVDEVVLIGGAGGTPPAAPAAPPSPLTAPPAGGSPGGSER